MVMSVDQAIEYCKKTGNAVKVETGKSDFCVFNEKDNWFYTTDIYSGNIKLEPFCHKTNVISVRGLTGFDY